MKLQKPKGTQDILPTESAKWQYVEGLRVKSSSATTTQKYVLLFFEHYESYQSLCRRHNRYRDQGNV